MGPPEVGEAVQVKWPDGLFYGAKYLGSNISYMYQVGHTVDLEEKKKSLWTPENKMSKGSVMFYLGFMFLHH